MDLAAQFVHGLYLAQITAALFFSIVFWRYALRYDHSYLALWSRSWGSLAVYLVFASISLYIALNIDPLSHWRTASTAVSLSAALAQITWLLAGTYEIALGRRSRHRLLWALAGLCVVLGCVAALIAHDDPAAGRLRLALRVATPALLTGTAFLASAGLLARWRWQSGSLGLKIVIGVFFLYGLHLLNYGVFNLDPGLYSETVRQLFTFTGLVDFLATGAVAVGLIMWMLEEEHERAISATRRADLLASHDPLTGLPNRAALMDQLDRQLRGMDHPEQRLAICVIDVDRFKSINDALGHPAGDAVLTRAGETIAQHLRETDQVARLGDDEFAVLMTGLDDGVEAVSAAERLLALFRNPMAILGRTVQSTVSIGLAVAPKHGREAEDLLQHASAAVREARKGGGNALVVYSTEMGSHTAEELDFENELRRAVEEGQFTLRYQPIISMPERRIVAAEGLIRWSHPERGILAPGEFLALAHQLGLGADIDRWVLTTACEQLRGWQDAGHPIQVSVNLSAASLDRRDFPDTLERIIVPAGIEPRLLCLEITEHAAMSDLEQGRECLHRIQRMGVEVVIDDFGVGYSSFAHLNRLPVQGIKIDKSFIQKLDQDRREAAIVSALISMALGLGLKVVAEGIETEFQERFLVKQGCSRLQGFRYAQPLTSTDLEQQMNLTEAAR